MIIRATTWIHLKVRVLHLAKYRLEIHFHITHHLKDSSVVLCQRHGLHFFFLFLRSITGLLALETGLSASALKPQVKRLKVSSIRHFIDYPSREDEDSGKRKVKEKIIRLKSSK